MEHLETMKPAAIEFESLLLEVKEELKTKNPFADYYVKQ